jgi:hypothetical protein
VLLVAHPSDGQHEAILEEVEMNDGSIYISTAAIVVIGLIVIGVIASNQNKSEEVSVDPNITLARICKEGTYIYHYPDGAYRTHLGYRIDDVNSICN